MNKEAVELYDRLKVIYPNRTLVLDHGINPGGVSWIDIDRIGIVYYPDRKQFEVWSCPPGCAAENHAFQYHGDIYCNTQELALAVVKELFDNNLYTHTLENPTP